MTVTEDAWDIQKLLQWTTSHLASKGIASARLDSELLLAHVLDCRRLDLYLRFDQPMRAAELATFKTLVIRRSQREPVAYITGRQEFFSRPFHVGEGALIPRPETEHIVSEASSWLKKQSRSDFSVLDIGCGSGVIGLTLACEHENIKITSLDISIEALSFTKKNAESLKVSERVSVIHSNYLSWSGGEFDLIVSNPPYIAQSEQASLMKDVSHYEPEIALYGGAQGFETLAAWLPRMANQLKEDGLLLCEIGFDQKEIAKDLAAKCLSLGHIEIVADYSGHPRVLKAIKRRESEV